MLLADELRNIAREQNRDADLPDTLLATLLELADNPRLTDQADDVQSLISLLKVFDPYAGTGCFSEASSAQEIENTIKRLRHKLEG